MHICAKYKLICGIGKKVFASRWFLEKLRPDPSHTPQRLRGSQALIPIPLHQRDKFMQLAMWDAAPANFKYVIAPSRLRAMAQKYTNNKSAVVIGVVRRPDWNAAQTFPEYICIAALEGGNALRIRVKQWSVGGNELPKWPGGGSIYLSLEEIRQQGYLFRPFCDNFD
jgi:hypothetical protein